VDSAYLERIELVPDLEAVDNRHHDSQDFRESTERPRIDQDLGVALWRSVAGDNGIKLVFSSSLTPRRNKLT
jgi:hypothetical protein